jgi:lysozyme
VARSAALVLGVLGSSIAVAGCGGGGGGSGSASAAAAVTSGTTAGATSGSGSGSTAGGGGGQVTPLPLPDGPVGGPRAKGIDVSRWQGTIDWARVKGDGIDFAIARVSDGVNTRDATFAPNWAGMRAQGLVRGVYQFFRPSQDAAQQADLLVDAVKAIGGFQAGDLPPVLDLETRDGVSAAQVISRMDAWIARIVQRTGLHPLIYTSPSFWGALGAPSHGDECDLWIAHWGVSSPTIPSGWRAFMVWQTSDNGTVAGISGAVDTDVFNGSVADLRAYAAAQGSGYYRGLAADSTGRGYWLAGVTGGVLPYGDATFRGTAGGQRRSQPIVGIVRTPTGLGYWLFGRDGKVLGFGDAVEVGDLAGQTLPAPVTAMAATATGRGYWLFTRDGRVHAFGDAQMFGEPAGAVTGTVVAAAATATGLGYWTVTADGVVSGFGDAATAGDLAGQALTSPVTGIAATPSGRGYWVVQADGRLSAFGDAPSLTYSGTRTAGGPVVGIAATSTGRGCWLVADDGVVLACGDAFDAGPRAR